jgi:uncharacterized protein (TIGR02996 family)
MHDAFLSAVVESPDDDLPRLAYADWLDENGQPERAELIRVQCEMARTERWTPRHAELSARSDALLSPANLREWAVPLGFQPYPNNFGRGFVERDCFAPSRFLALAPAIFERAPLRQVDLMTPDAGGDTYTGVNSAAEERLREEVVASAALAPARELVLFDLGPKTASRLARSPHLARLEKLGLYGGPAADALEVIASGRLTGLRGLTLSAHNDPPPESPRDGGVAALERSDLAPRLTELCLIDLHVTAAGAACLASGRWAALRRLYLDDDAIGNAGVAAVLHSPLAPNWSALTFRGRWLTGRAVRAVAECPGLVGLEELRLEARRVTADDVTRLLLSPHLGRLRELTLSGVSADTFLTAAAQVPETARLRRIFLGEGSGMTAAGAEALLRRSALDEVTSIGFVGRPSRVPWEVFDQVIRKLGPRLDLH